MPRRGAVTTISISPETRELLRRLRDEMGAASFEEVIVKLASAREARECSRSELTVEDASVEVLEFVAMLRLLAHKEPSRVVNFIERKLAPLLSSVYEEAKARLASKHEDENPQ